MKQFTIKKELVTFLALFILTFIFFETADLEGRLVTFAIMISFLIVTTMYLGFNHLKRNLLTFLVCIINIVAVLFIENNYVYTINSFLLFPSYFFYIINYQTYAKLTSKQILSNFFNTYIVIPFRQFVYMAENIRNISRSIKVDSIPKGFTGKVFIGLIISMPITLMSYAFLKLANPDFPSILSIIAAFINWTAILSFILTLLLCNIIFGTYHSEADSYTKRLKKNKYYLPQHNIIFIIIILALIPLYIINVYLQTTIILDTTSSLADKTTQSFTFTNIAVSLNLFLLYLSFVYTSKKQVLSRVISAIFAILTLISVILSLYLLIDYIQNFYLTTNRYIAFIELTTLLIFIILILFKLTNDKFPLIKTSLIILFISFTTLSVIDPNYVVYQYDSSISEYSDQDYLDSLEFYGHEKS